MGRGSEYHDMSHSAGADKAAIRLLTAARALLERGDTRFSVDRLCREARVTRHDFDRHFESRAALFRALVKPSAAEAVLEKRIVQFEKSLADLSGNVRKAEQAQAEAIARLEEKFKGDGPRSYFELLHLAARRCQLPRLPSRRMAMVGIAVLFAAMTAGIPLLQAARGNNAPRGEGADSIAMLQARAGDGDAKAQSALAFAYLGSPGVARDVSAAARWARAAADQGDVNAQYLIGSLSLAGTGVPRDPEQAVSWFTRSAAAGNVKAMHNLAIAYVQGNGAPKNPAAAARWFARAASQGYVDSAFDLAVLYEQGLGVEQNPREALRWYRVAAAAGDRSAAARAHFLETDGQP